tara:strand:- start:1079 stop:1327 length:249 start_codon:yes stop_codon:yes gene_type:complete
MKPITVDDYREVSDEFFDKYHFVAKELGEGCKAEEILKVMEALGALVVKNRKDNSSGPWGFLKDTKNDKKIDDQLGYDTYSK